MDERWGEAAERLRAAITGAGAGLVEREALVETIALAVVAGEHVLVIGPPGAAKSEAVRRVARATSGGYFEYLIGRFTEPSEIFGPVDLRKLREGVVETLPRVRLRGWIRQACRCIGTWSQATWAPSPSRTPLIYPAAGVL